MTESHTPSKSFKIVHWAALLFLFLMIAQPTFGNVSALITGNLVMGDVSVPVTFSKMALHLLAAVIGWLGLWWFFKRQKRGAYLSLAAHSLGLVASATQTPELLDAIPTPALVVFFVILATVTLGPIGVFKDQYS